MSQAMINMELGESFPYPVVGEEVGHHMVPVLIFHVACVQESKILKEDTDESRALLHKVCHASLWPATITRCRSSRLCAASGPTPRNSSC